MTTKDGFSKLSIIFLVAALAFIGYFLLAKYKHQAVAPTKEAEIQTSFSVFQNLLNNSQIATWTEPSAQSIQTSYGNLKGVSVSGQTTSKTASFPHFENTKTLAQEQYILDTNLSADGPGSSVWGYKKTEGEQAKVVLFSYSTVPSSSNPNEPLSFDCPCKVKLSVFISDSF